MSIPNNLFIFWHDFGSCPDMIVNAINTTTKTHANLKTTLVDDSYIETFISKNYDKEKLKLYLLNKIAASRSDLARLLLLHHYGGLYVDASMAFHKSINLSNYSEKEIILVKRDDQCSITFPNDLHIINGIIIARKGALLLKTLIDQAFKNLSKGTYNYNVSWATGPKMLSRTLINRDSLINEEVKFLSFTDLKKNYFTHMRNRGVATSRWLEQQQKGIIDRHYYTNEQQEKWLDYPGYINRLPVSVF